MDPQEESLELVQHPLREQAVNLPARPGVYRFLDGAGVVLYVGKAKDLRRRVSSYFVPQRLSLRIQLMVSRARALEITVTNTENEALILEANLIKRYRPRFNVLLRDDKSYPYLHLSEDHDFPRLSIYRGDRREKGRYFGPYPSTTALRETLKWLQRVFPLRQCEDSDFSRRQRPCLQHQIGRCAAPCCHLTSQERYGEWIRELVLFLEGRDRQLLSRLEESMWQAAATNQFEEAARLRDRLHAIGQVVEKRKVQLTAGKGGQGIDLDVVYVARLNEVTVVELFMIRGGLNLGNRSFFPENAAEGELPQILASFLGQYYSRHQPPAEVLVSHDPPEKSWLLAALTQQWEKSVSLHRPLRGEKVHLMTMAENNAMDALQRKLGTLRGMSEQLAGLAALLEMKHIPKRVEAFDISHHQSDSAVGAMVVFGVEGFQRDHYRRYAIQDISLPDDTTRMEEVLFRRYGQGSKEEGVVPDLILLDGGEAQLAVGQRVVAQSPVLSQVVLCAFAKGPQRKIGKERLFVAGSATPLILDPHSPIMFLLQNIRDEVHRFAINYHRAKKGSSITHSRLEEIPGVGAARKKALLRHFGSLAAIRQAGEEALSQVTGISRELAQKICSYLQQE
ncbi:MAG: excinuclease ABC subunit UvrC [Magnetococcales bacterium]|nr:excinuclease ABC subunit UvrC [Magnetococcales bacterium]NGZ27113.1 excinuclease ABC subunit UvrC [Magnetococcales bacterium]